jgi:hypothetical protein
MSNTPLFDSQMTETEYTPTVIFDTWNSRASSPVLSPIDYDSQVQRERAAYDRRDRLEFEARTRAPSPLVADQSQPLTTWRPEAELIEFNYDSAVTVINHAHVYEEDSHEFGVEIDFDVDFDDDFLNESHVYDDDSVIDLTGDTEDTNHEVDYSFDAREPDAMDY